MTELVDVRADAVGPGEHISIFGTMLLITAVEARGKVVDLYTEYGPALRFLRSESVELVVAASAHAA